MLLRPALVFVFLLFATSAMFAAAPANDEPANAVSLTGPSGQSAPVSNLEATKYYYEANHAQNAGGKSVWYKFWAPGDGAVLISTNLSNFDTLLAVYEDGNLIAENDNIIGPGFGCTCSAVKIGVTVGKTYLIAVDGKDGAGGNVVVSYSLANSVSNDNFANAYSLLSSGGRMETTTNVGASKESGEPNHAGNPGGKSVWYKWTSGSSVPKLYDFVLDSRAVVGSTPPQTLFAIYTGSSVSNLTLVGQGDRSKRSRIVLRAMPGVTYYIAIDGNDSGSGATLVTTMLRYGPFKSARTPQIDRDGKADLVVFRPTTGRWHTRESLSTYSGYHNWGTNGDVPLMGDFNGDGTFDFTVFRPDIGTWWIEQPIDCCSSTMNRIRWGTAGDVPLVREIHASAFGINAMSLAIFRGIEGSWYLTADGSSGTTVKWGSLGDIPVMADFAGTGVDQLTVYRPSNGTWYIQSDPIRIVQFGSSGDRPVPADFDGDGLTDVAVFRPSTGDWYILRSSDGQVQVTHFGTASDVPQPADYDGDGKDDLAVFRNGQWWVLQSSNGAITLTWFGTTGDIPVVAPRY